MTDMKIERENVKKYVTEDEYIGNGSLLELAKRIADIIEMVPSEYRDAAQVEPGYDGEIHVYYTAPEDDETYNKRVEKIRKQNERIKAKELAELERLEKIYR